MNKSDFPFFKLAENKSYSYLDSAATTLKPEVVINAIAQNYANLSGSARRGLYEGSEQSTTLIEEARKSVAQLLHVNSDTIIFTKNTTDSINIVALSWGEQNIQEGDEIVVTAREHHANFVPWQQLAQRKRAQFIVIPVDLQGELVENALDYITPKTKLFAMGQVSNVTGVVSKYLNDLCKKAQELGVTILIDGAQAASYIENPLKNLDPDFYVFSAHKMCGPFNIGVLYVKKSRQSQMQPALFGGGAVFQVTEKQTTFLPFPHCFEPGTLPAPEIAGFKAAIQYVQTIGISKIASHSNKLVRLFLDSIDRSKITIVGDYHRIYNESHLVSFVLKGFHAHDVAAYLASHAIAVRAGDHCAQPLHKSLEIDSSVRVSFYIYNTEDDVKKVVDLLHQLLK